MAVIIGTASKAVDKHGAGIHGFTAGDPQAGIAPTQLSDDWADGVQQEINNAIETIGGLGTLDNAIRTQLGDAIFALSFLIGGVFFLFGKVSYHEMRAAAK
jgi:hypothetical protein